MYKKPGDYTGVTVLNLRVEPPFGCPPHEIEGIRGWGRTIKFSLAMQGASPTISPDGSKDMAEQIRTDRGPLSESSRAAAAQEIKGLKSRIDACLEQLRLIRPMRTMINNNYDRIAADMAVLEDRLEFVQQGQLEFEFIARPEDDGSEARPEDAQ